MVYNLGDTWKFYWQKKTIILVLTMFAFTHVGRAHYKSTTKFLLLKNFFTCYNFYVNFSLDGWNRFEIVSLIEYTIFGLKVFARVGLFVWQFTGGMVWLYYTINSFWQRKLLICNNIFDLWLYLFFRQYKVSNCHNYNYKIDGFFLHCPKKNYKIETSAL